MTSGSKQLPEVMSHRQTRRRWQQPVDQQRGGPNAATRPFTSTAMRRNKLSAAMAAGMVAMMLCHGGPTLNVAAAASSSLSFDLTTPRHYSPSSPGMAVGVGTGGGSYSGDGGADGDEEEVGAGCVRDICRMAGASQAGAGSHSTTLPKWGVAEDTVLILVDTFEDSANGDCAPGHQHGTCNLRAALRRCGGTHDVIIDLPIVDDEGGGLHQLLLGDVLVTGMMPSKCTVQAAMPERCSTSHHAAINRTAHIIPTSSALGGALGDDDHQPRLVPRGLVTLVLNCLKFYPAAGSGANGSGGLAYSNLMRSASVTDAVERGAFEPLPLGDASIDGGCHVTFGFNFSAASATALTSVVAADTTVQSGNTGADIMDNASNCTNASNLTNATNCTTTAVDSLDTDAAAAGAAPSDIAACCASCAATPECRSFVFASSGSGSDDSDDDASAQASCVLFSDPFVTPECHPLCDGAMHSHRLPAAQHQTPLVASGGLPSCGDRPRAAPPIATDTDEGRQACGGCAASSPVATAFVPALGICTSCELTSLVAGQTSRVRLNATAAATQDDSNVNTSSSSSSQYNLTWCV